MVPRLTNVFGVDPINIDVKDVDATLSQRRIGSAAILTVGTPTGVSVEINVSYLDSAYPGEEVEVEAKALRVGKAVGVVSVELRKKKTGKIIAQGRHTEYLALAGKL
ncbi:acyl-coenzyme A thioesterase 13-like [Prunus avium]|uniref:Acyl-coenzyme A thioesterase 13-like n=1 Tax=Prunus avium TaxID=42229 RepID=A0A6P5T0H6_PRUAV|nr:acyl-coenzyme A thioesterase 13-like [Prunus avium]